tara:strand:+ start:1200 stop:1820 length:621 start_codon:yes stop_codon:yes gene_type:complete
MASVEKDTIQPISWNENNFDVHDESYKIFENIEGNRTSVDNILRLNYNYQLRLTLMADTKANIMITVSSIVFSITIANITTELLFYPLLALGICSVIALVCAIIVIMPKIDFPKTKTGKIDKTSPFYNPLFFGHFAHISILEYKQEYAKRLQTDAQIINALTGDLYGIGRVIATNKFKYLRYSYTSFLIGLSLAITIIAGQILSIS